MIKIAYGEFVVLFHRNELIPDTILVDWLSDSHNKTMSLVLSSPQKTCNNDNVEAHYEYNKQLIKQVSNLFDEPIDDIALGVCAAYMISRGGEGTAAYSIYQSALHSEVDSESWIWYIRECIRYTAMAHYIQHQKPTNELAAIIDLLKAGKERFSLEWPQMLQEAADSQYE